MHLGRDRGHAQAPACRRRRVAQRTGQGAAWAGDGLDLDIAVNISAMHFATGTLVDDVLGALGQSGLDPKRLMLELTETSVARNPGQAAEQFSRLREHGIRIAIADLLRLRREHGLEI